MINHTKEVSVEKNINFRNFVIDYKFSVYPKDSGLISCNMCKTSLYLGRRSGSIDRANSRGIVKCVV